MFPAHSLDRRDPGAPAKAVGFIGRSLDPAAGTEAGSPKYLNCPDTALYRKSELLYGLHGSGRAVQCLSNGAR